MAIERTKLWSYLAAVLLSVTTLFVFATLQDYGPESAIRRFHEAIQNNSAEQLQQVVVEPTNSTPVTALVNTAGRFMGYGFQYKVVRTSRSAGQVIAAVVYTAPGRLPAWVIYVVVQDRNAWKVDAQATMRASVEGAFTGMQFAPSNSGPNSPQPGRNTVTREARTGP